MPKFMIFSQGKQAIAVNMDQVCWISPNGDKGTIMTFGFTIGDESAYIVVDDDMVDIANRSEWSSK